MTKDIFDVYKQTDRSMAPNENEVRRARRFVFWHKWGWITMVSGAAIYLATIVPFWIVGTVLGTAGIFAVVCGIIWLVERDDKNRRILKDAKQLGVRKDV